MADLGSPALALRGLSLLAALDFPAVPGALFDRVLALVLDARCPDGRKPYPGPASPCNCDCRGVAVSMDEIDFGACFDGGARGAALVLGNERRGVSRTLVEAADGAFFLPMSGFTQSFNVGVACGMSLGAAVATGRFAEGTLDDDEQAELLGRWLLRDIKAAHGLLAQAGVVFEDF